MNCIEQFKLSKMISKVKDLFNFKRKAGGGQEHFPEDENAPVPNQNSVKNRIKDYYEKSINYIDSILWLFAIWASIVVFLYAKPHLPELGWSFHLDEFLFIAGIYILVYFTIKKLRPVVFASLFLGVTYLMVEIVLDVYQDSINKTKTSQTINFGDQEAIMALVSKLSGDQQPVLQKLDSIQKLNTDLNIRLMTLERKHDSLSRRLKTNKSAKKK